MLRSYLLVDGALVFLRRGVHLLSYRVGSIDAFGQLCVQNAVAWPHWPSWIHSDGIDMPPMESRSRTTPDQMPEDENARKGKLMTASHEKALSDQN
jgi:hypothetical protein